MSQPPEVLLTIGEVAIAYVGFASIVAVLSASREGAWSVGDRIVFRAMIEVGFLTVLVSFLPRAVALTDLPEGGLWQVCSGINVLAGVAMVIRRVRQLQRHAGGVLPFGRAFALPLTGVHLLLNAVNVAVWHTAWPYVAAMVISLAVASGMFLFLLFRFFPLDDD